MMGLPRKSTAARLVQPSKNPLGRILILWHAVHTRVGKRFETLPVPAAAAYVTNQKQQMPIYPPPRTTAGTHLLLSSRKLCSRVSSMTSFGMASTRLSEAFRSSRLVHTPSHESAKPAVVRIAVV